MNPFLRNALGSCAALCATAGLCWGQSLGLPGPKDDVQVLKALVEKQQKQIDDLKQAITTTNVSNPGVDATTVKSIIADYLRENPTGGAAPAAPGAPAAGDGDGYRIGSNTGVSAKFENGFLWLRTPNNDFTMHIGYWVQWDNVWWDTAQALKVGPGARPGAKQGVASGAALGGIGLLEDGTDFRRIRPFIEGTLWDTYEYRLNLALENMQFNTSGLDEFWFAVNYIPVIGTIRGGHIKNASGLEADMSASSRCMTFMERSSYSEAIELNQNFTTGVWLHNAFVDERTTYTLSAFRVDNGQSSGTFFGDGQWGWQGRLTALPLYECEGRHYMHVGLSGGGRNGTNNLATSPLHVIQLRARPELRDDDPAAAGAVVVPNANNNRMVDTGVIAAQRDFLMGLEFLYVRGPFSIQAEYGWNWVDRAIGFAPVGLTLNPKLNLPTDYVFDGGYVQLAYTLTGESRSYDKKNGTLDRYYFGKRGPFTNAWLVRDDNGGLNWGLGAWELAARYSYVNLNDGAGLNRINGGKMDGFSFALNWYLNSNLTWNFDYVLDHRYSLPGGVNTGWTGGFGTRIQLSF